MQTKLSDGSVMVCGVLPRDAEYKTVGQNNSSLTTFGVKVGERTSLDAGSKPDAVWCNCVCWHAVARAAQNLKKNDVVLCVGKIKVENYTDNNGKAQTAKKLVCELVLTMTQAQAQAAVQTAKVDDLSDYEEILGNDDDPF